MVTQAWALKVSDVLGATHNRIGSNRYRYGQRAQASDRRGETPVAVIPDARVSWCSLAGDEGSKSISLQRRVCEPSVPLCAAIAFWIFKDYSPCGQFMRMGSRPSQFRAASRT